MKKILALLLALAMVLALASCGGNSSAQSTSPSEAQVETETEGNAGEEQEDMAVAPAEVTLENLLTFPTTQEDAFETTDVDGGVSITGCSVNDMVIVVPKQIDGKSVVSVGQSAFFSNETSAIVLPDTVSEIMRGAFFGCSNLRYIHLGKGVKQVADNVFGACEQLAAVEFPVGIESIGYAVFDSCTELGEISIPSSAEIDGGMINIKSCPNAVIVTPAGSPAEATALEYGIPVRNS